MTKHVKYRGLASTREAAEELAKRLLLQVVETGGGFSVVTTRRTDSPSESVILLPSGVEAPEGYEDKKNYIPIVYIHRTRQETPEAEGLYNVYLLFDKSRLPFLFRNATGVTVSGTTGLEILLPLMEPTIKPVDALPVEAILTKEGVDYMEEALTSYETETPDKPTPIDREIARVKDAPKDKRLYYFVDTYGGEGTLEEIESEVEEGAYDIDVVDGELVLNALTGGTYRTEEEYLSALADFIGKKETEKYKDNFLRTYRLCKALRFVDYLEYELLRTEDFSYVEAHYSEYASAVGYKEGYIKRITKDGDFSALEYALAKYLKDFIHFSNFFAGLSEKRLADYLNVPEAYIHRIYTEVIDNSLL